ncbi:hypothetical protein [Pectobacterium brasiliense]|nr:hypothetical protein [Pectobacterium brasiliense]
MAATVILVKLGLYTAVEADNQETLCTRYLIEQTHHDASLPAS